MSEKIMSLEDRRQRMGKCGCTVVDEHTTEDISKDNETGANRLGFYLEDGAYRIVQVGRDNEIMDAITQGMSTPGKEANVTMGQYPNNFKQVIWQIHRQYGVKNSFTIVPQDVTLGGDKLELGATAAPEGNNVTTKRSGCYPIWRIEGSGALVYRDDEADPDKRFNMIRYFRIFEAGTNRCWRTEKNDNVALVEATKGRPPMSQLFEIYSVGKSVQSVAAQSTSQLSVLARDATLVKKCYVSTKPFGFEDVMRNISIQAVTDSRDQGWASNPDRGQWSWFEIAIFEKQPTEGQDVQPNDIKQYEGKPLTWTSHQNRLSSEYKETEGPKFTWDHPIWRHIEEGNCVALLCCAQFRAWRNDIRGGSIKMESIDMNAILTEAKVSKQ